jgi:hypothetical protein
MVGVVTSTSLPFLIWTIYLPPLFLVHVGLEFRTFPAVPHAMLRARSTKDWAVTDEHRPVIRPRGVINHSDPLRSDFIIATMLASIDGDVDPELVIQPPVFHHLLATAARRSFRSPRFCWLPERVPVPGPGDDEVLEIVPLPDRFVYLRAIPALHLPAAEATIVTFPAQVDAQDEFCFAARAGDDLLPFPNFPLE